MICEPKIYLRIVLGLIIAVSICCVPLVSGEKLDTQDAKILYSQLKFNDSQEEVVLQEAFNIKNEKKSNNIPYGSIIYHSKDGTTRVFDKDGKQLFITNDADSKRIITPQGNMPTSWSFEIPNASFIRNNGQIIQVSYNNETLFSIVTPDEVKSIKVPDASMYEWFEQSKYDSVNNLDEFDADWIVPSKPTKSQSPAHDFYFTGIMPQNAPVSGTTLIQPVLEWNNGISNKWAIRPWVIVQGNSLTPDPIEVNETDTIRGMMAWSESLNAWQIATRDNAHPGTSLIIYNDTGGGGGGTRLGTDHLKVACVLEGYLVSDNTDLPGTTQFKDMTFLYNHNPVSFTWEKWYNPDKITLPHGLYVDPLSQSQVTLYTDKTYTISPTAGDGGSTSPPSGSNIPVLSGQDYIVSIMTNDPSSIIIERVYADGVYVGKNASYTFYNINENHTLLATFIHYYWVTPTPAPHGSINPPSAVQVSHGGNQTFNITPDDGYGIQDVIVSGVSQGPISNYTFTNVQEAGSISATFRPLSSTTPIADFTASPTSGQNAPLPVQFNDAATGAKTDQWFWSFGDGATSTLQNPLHQYTANGTYTVSFTATNLTGGSDTRKKTNYITVGPLYAKTVGNDTVVIFNKTGSTVWAPPAGVANVDYLVVGGGGEGGNGGVFGSQSYAGGGGGGGGVMTGTAFTITGAQTVNVGAGGSGTSGTVVNAKDGENSMFGTVAHNIVAYGGGYGGGYNGATGISGHQGASGGGGSAAALAGGNAIPSGQGNAGGSGSDVLSSHPGGGGGGAGSPGLTPTNLTVAGNGGDGRLVSITGENIYYGAGGGGGIESYNNPGFGGKGCGGNGSSSSGDPARCQGTGGGGGGSGITSHGAGGSGVVIIRYLTPVVNAPVASFTASPTSGTAPLTVTFTDTSTGSPTGWLWNFGDGDNTNRTEQNPVHTYLVNGKYTVGLIAINSGGSNVTTKSDYIHVDSSSSQPMLPYAIIEVNTTSGNIPLAVSFNGSTVGGSTNGWFWDFGDGQTSTLQNPVHTYVARGNYTINLIVNNSAGTTSSVLQNWIRAGYHMVTVEQSLNNSTIMLSKNDFIRVNLSENPSTGYGWVLNVSPGLNIVNITSVPTPNPFHLDGNWEIRVWDILATEPGEQNITANYHQGTDPYSGNPTFKVNVTVNSPQIISSNGTIVYCDFEGGFYGIVTDDNKHYDPTPTLGNEFEVDGLRVTFEGIEHPDMYTIRMFGIPIEITSMTLLPPVANFSTTAVNGTVPLIVAFNDTSTNLPTSWYWEFGDGYYANGRNVTWLYNIPGTYSVRHSATNSGGTGWINQTGYVTVEEYIPPVPPGSISNLHNGTVTNNSILWTWTNPADPDYADLIVYKNNILFTTYPNSTTSVLWTNLTASTQYTISTHSEDSLGNINATWVNATVTTASNPVIPSVPLANFTATPTTGNSPLTVQFTDTSANNPTSWNWNFGDGSTENATQRNPVHTYMYSAHIHSPFTVNLTTTNSAGSNTISKPGYINVFRPVEVSFTATPQSGRSPLTVIFTDTSTGSPTSWNWNFGDGNTTNSTVRNPLHTYLANGVYSVTLTATNSNGSSGTKTITSYITVSPNSPYTMIDGNYTVVIFNSTGPMTWIPPSGVTQINYLVVAGGGAGGSLIMGGGGGAGGLVSSSTIVSAGIPYTITIGSGGQLSTLPFGGQGMPGGASSIRGGSVNITATGGGGGGGGSTTNNGGNGGSGGGGNCMGVAAMGGNGIAGQGNNGGGASSNPSGGGGGGAGAGGQTAISISGGAGGTGIVNTITGIPVYYAGGGGGGALGLGGNGGGGSHGQAGTASTGGGGGYGGSGGSGIVIIRYLTPV